MAPIEHINIYTDVLNQQNTTNFTHHAYNVNSKTDKLSSIGNQKLVDNLDHTNKTSYEKYSSSDSAKKENLITSVIYQYFSWISYFIGNL